MIIFIAGTNGSGKTTVVRNFLTKCKKVADDPRGNGSLYELDDKTVFVVGRYRDDLQTSGADTIKDITQIFSILSQLGEQGRDGVVEGAYVMNHTRGPALARAYPTTVIALTTPLEVCKTDIQARRARNGRAPLTDFQHVEGSYKRATNFATKMKAAGSTVIRATRDEAVSALIKALT